MRRCIIFNPAARGRRAKRRLQLLETLTPKPELYPTTGPGSAIAIVKEAISKDFDVIIAAGGDGTLNEVVNGIFSVPGGNSRVRLGILPLGTMNVFAREVGIPRNPLKAWETILEGHETKTDVGRIQFLKSGTAPRYFVQMAGVGLDARAIELVDLRLKQILGPFAYILAMLRALKESHPPISIQTEDRGYNGEFVLIGNGQRYGGDFRVFPEANIFDGHLDVCVVPRVCLARILLLGLKLIITGRLDGKGIVRFRSKNFRIQATDRVPVEADGEAVGTLPVTVSVMPLSLTVIVPRKN